MERAPRHWLAWSAAGLALAAAWPLVPWYALSVAVPGAGPVAPDGSPCLLRAWTGLACPTCGLTRGLALLAHGDWRGSWALHPWAALLVLQAGGAWLLWGAWLAGWLRRRPDRWMPHAAVANAVLLALLWATRLATGTLPG